MCPDTHTPPSLWLHCRRGIPQGKGCSALIQWQVRGQCFCFRARQRYFQEEPGQTICGSKVMLLTQVLFPYRSPSASCPSGDKNKVAGTCPVHSALSLLPWCCIHKEIRGGRQQGEAAVAELREHSWQTPQRCDLSKEEEEFLRFLQDTDTRSLSKRNGVGEMKSTTKSFMHLSHLEAF